MNEYIISHATLGELEFYDKATHSESLEEYTIYSLEDGQVVALPSTVNIHSITATVDSLPPVNYDDGVLGGKKIQHFKGGMYTYHGWVYDLHLKELAVEYTSDETRKNWIRPAVSFNSVANVPRFKFVD